jgi:heme-degrading monooxygenase HmoA
MSQMQLALPPLKKVSGLSFFRMLGTGRRFHYFPDFSVYCLLAVWDNEDAARYFFAHHPRFRAFTERSHEHWTLYLKSYQAHGYWSGEQPFTSTASPPEPNQPVAVLTRATINPRRLRGFWKQALRINRQFAQHTDCWLSLGVGEWPVVQQATFSLWKDADSMKQFAYRSDLHRQAVRHTRQHGWFTEDLFARFVPIGSEGSWEGRDPLAAGLGR